MVGDSEELAAGGGLYPLLGLFDAGKLAVVVSIKMALSRNERCVFEDHRVYFYMPREPPFVTGFEKTRLPCTNTNI